MKNYRIKIVCKLTNTLIDDKYELSKNKSSLMKKYESITRFNSPKSKIIIELVNDCSTNQTNIIDSIKEMEVSNG